MLNYFFFKVNISSICLHFANFFHYRYDVLKCSSTLDDKLQHRVLQDICYTRTLLSVQTQCSYRKSLISEQTDCVLISLTAVNAGIPEFDVRRVSLVASVVCHVPLLAVPEHVVYSVLV
jgi:hypothetical protein